MAIFNMSSATFLVTSFTLRGPPIIHYIYYISYNIYDYKIIIKKR